MQHYCTFASCNAFWNWRQSCLGKHVARLTSSHVDRREMAEIHRSVIVFDTVFQRRSYLIPSWDCNWCSYVNFHSTAQHVWYTTSIAINTASYVTSYVKTPSVVWEICHTSSRPLGTLGVWRNVAMDWTKRILHWPSGRTCAVCRGGEEWGRGGLEVPLV